ncbi:mechanosensitive ion channel [Mangrovimicrobium sediminis]|uniref:Mechanosensitive ion channel n=1 Tax=Mangrovimicrobium sediminis TaxID=2562682 RepID=A0A4Z0LZK2_9GAMM|nr:mechanosensitive ion channel domain-containing protein [Haliea sp. SAOS-164]TGD72587.1 mechanosensitive ion channel [Haliea sp. SAOS-164]
MPNALLRLLLLVCTCLAPLYAMAQEAPQQSDISARELLEAAEKTERVQAERGRDAAGTGEEAATPMSAVLGLREALRARDYATASSYLDRRYVDEYVGKYSDEQLVRALAYVWNQQNIVDITGISDLPEGNLDDGLPSYRDQIGSIKLLEETIPVYLQRVPDGSGGKQWKLSNATVARIPDMWRELGYSPLAVKLGDWLPQFRVLGMENWQVIALVLSFLVAWPLASLVSYLLMRIALVIPNNFPDGIRRFFRRTVRFFAFLIIARMLIGQIGLSLTTRILLNSSGIEFVAAAVLVLGLLSLLRDYQIRKLQHAGNTQYVALLRPFTTMLKVLVVTIIALVWANQAGYDMSTILAGLGVGSLAVALAAQKTLENLIGAITLYTARPVSAGDFCRFGDITGTVEEIGLRSTVLRTLDRSLVYIPNSVFSSQEVENFTARDRIRYFRRFQMQLPGSAELREILGEVRQLFANTAEVIDDTISVRFEDIRDANAILRLDAGIATRDFQQFLAVAEELNLGIMAIAEHAGARFTGPGMLLQGADSSAE